MPAAEPVLIVALSGRALAQAARRVGFAPYVVDAFADEDTREVAVATARVPVDRHLRFDPEALLEAATRLAPPPVPLVWGGGFDEDPALLARLAAGRELLGHSPAGLRELKDPIAFAARLARLGLPHPEVRLTPPEDEAGWLVKRAGGSGGGHVRRARRGDAATPGRYWQRWAPGRPVSALVLGDGSQAVTLGLSEQWADEAPDAPPYRFAGVVVPSRLAADVAAACSEDAAALAADVGLIGLGSVDGLAAGDSHVVLEINPRPGGSLDAFELAAEASLFARHVAACRGRLVPTPLRLARAAASRVVYATADSVIPPELSWPAWVADRPATGLRIAAGEPLCTVLAAAPTADKARVSIAQRADAVLGLVPTQPQIVSQGVPSPSRSSPRMPHC